LRSTGRWFPAIYSLKAGTYSNPDPRQPPPVLTLWATVVAERLRYPGWF